MPAIAARGAARRSVPVHQPGRAGRGGERCDHHFEARLGGERDRAGHQTPAYRTTASSAPVSRDGARVRAAVSAPRAAIREPPVSPEGVPVAAPAADIAAAKLAPRLKVPPDSGISAFARVKLVLLFRAPETALKPVSADFSVRADRHCLLPRSAAPEPSGRRGKMRKTKEQAGYGAHPADPHSSRDPRDGRGTIDPSVLHHARTSIHSTRLSGSCGTRGSGTATRSRSSSGTSSSRRAGRRTRPTSSPRSTSAGSSALPSASGRSSR